MADINGYIRQIETATRGEQVRDAIIGALNTINSGGNVLSLNGISANKFITKDEWDAVFPLNTSVVDDSERGVTSDGIYEKLKQIADKVDEVINRESTSGTSIGDKLQTATLTINEIRNAIRNKEVALDTNAPLSEYANAIDSIEGNSDMNITDITITKNGTYPDIDQGGHSNDIYSTVTVDVQPEIIKNKSVTKVDSEGKFTLRIADEEGENRHKDGYDEVSIDVSGQLKDLILDPTKISDDPAEGTTTVFASNEVGESGSSAAIIGYKKVTLDIREKFAPLEVELDPSQTEEITYTAATGMGYDGGGTLYGYNTVKIKFVEASGPFTVRFWNGNELLKTVENVPKHGTATYNGPTPTKEGMRFVGWNPKPYDVVTNMDCNADFEEGNSAVSPSGDVGDSWNDIVNNGGADIPIGATKALFVGEHPCDVTGETLGETTTRPLTGITMVKVASNYKGHSSLWISKNPLPYAFRLYKIPYGSAALDNGSSFDGSDLYNYLNNEFLNAIVNSGRDKNGDVSDFAKGIKAVDIYCGVGYDGSDGDVQKSGRNVRASIWTPSSDELTFIINNLRNNEFGTSLTTSGGFSGAFRDVGTVSTSIVKEEKYYVMENGSQVEKYRYSANASLGVKQALNDTQCRECGFTSNGMIIGGGTNMWYYWFMALEGHPEYANQAMFDLSTFNKRTWICFCT